MRKTTVPLCKKGFAVDYGQWTVDNFKGALSHAITFH
jgi:hypothetical protein